MTDPYRALDAMFERRDGRTLSAALGVDLRNVVKMTLRSGRDADGTPWSAWNVSVLPPKDRKLKHRGLDDETYDKYPVLREAVPRVCVVQVSAAYPREMEVVMTGMPKFKALSSIDDDDVEVPETDADGSDTVAAAAAFTHKGVGAVFAFQKCNGHLWVAHATPGGRVFAGTKNCIHSLESLGRDLATVEFPSPMVADIFAALQAKFLVHGSALLAALQAEVLVGEVETNQHLVYHASPEMVVFNTSPATDGLFAKPKVDGPFSVGEVTSGRAWTKYRSGYNCEGVVLAGVPHPSAPAPILVRLKFKSVWYVCCRTLRESYREEDPPALTRWRLTQRVLAHNKYMLVDPEWLLTILREYLGPLVDYLAAVRVPRRQIAFDGEGFAPVLEAFRVASGWSVAHLQSLFTVPDRIPTLAEVKAVERREVKLLGPRPVVALTPEMSPDISARGRGSRGTRGSHNTRGSRGTRGNFGGRPQSRRLSPVPLASGPPRGPVHKPTATLHSTCDVGGGSAGACDGAGAGPGPGRESDTGTETAGAFTAPATIVACACMAPGAGKTTLMKRFVKRMEADVYKAPCRDMAQDDFAPNTKAFYPALEAAAAAVPCVCVHRSNFAPHDRARVIAAARGTKKHMVFVVPAEDPQGLEMLYVSLRGVLLDSRSTHPTLGAKSNLPPGKLLLIAGGFWADMCPIDLSREGDIAAVLRVRMTAGPLPEDIRTGLAAFASVMRTSNKRFALKEFPSFLDAGALVAMLLAGPELRRPVDAIVDDMVAQFREAVMVKTPSGSTPAPKAEVYFTTLHPDVGDGVSAGEPSKAPKVEYVGLFVAPEALVPYVVQAKSLTEADAVSADHVTLAFRPDADTLRELYAPLLGRKFDVCVDSMCVLRDRSIAALIVSVRDLPEAVAEAVTDPHITLMWKKGTRRPVDSAKLITGQLGPVDVYPVGAVVEGVVRYSMGNAGGGNAHAHTARGGRGRRGHK